MPRGAEVLLDKWTNRGLDPTVLARIRTEVFDASAPMPYSVPCLEPCPMWGEGPGEMSPAASS